MDPVSCGCHISKPLGVVSNGGSPEQALHNNNDNMACILPSEILIGIFELLVPTTAEADRDPYPAISETSWFWFSQVCRRWREVSLDAPYLWTNIDFQEFPWFTRIMLERSKNASLKVFIDLAGEGSWEAMASDERELFTEPLKSHIHHISSLSVVSWNHWGMISDLVGPAPRLETLLLESTLHYKCPELSSFAVSTPEGFLGGYTPSLSTLIIKVVLSQYTFAVGLVSNLTFLHLSLFTNSRWGLRPSFPEALALLNAAPGLESLFLDVRHSVDVSLDPVMNNIPLRTPETDVVSLTHLRSLRLEGSLDCIHFLGHLSFPSSTRVEVKSEFAPPSLLQTLMSTFAPLFDLFATPIASLVMDRVRGLLSNNIMVSAYDEEFDLSFQDTVSFPSKPPRFSFQTNSQIGADEILHTLLKALPLHHLRTLHLPASDFRSSPQLKNIVKSCFGSLPDLHSVSILGNLSAKDLIPILEDVVDVSVGRIGFPSLKTIVLRDWEEVWTRKSGYRAADGNYIQTGNMKYYLLDDLLDMLEVRKKMNVGVELVTFVDCKVSKEGVGRVKEVVCVSLVDTRTSPPV